MYLLGKVMLTNLSKMSSKVCPKCFMYSPMISSGPGAFPPLRLLRASCSSFGVIDRSTYEKKTPNPKKLIQKVFQWILVTFGMLNNILKI